jgi:hypothetical protein
MEAECAWDRKGHEPLTPDASEAWDLYAMASTQWRASMAGYTGLDYVAVEQAAEWGGIEITPRVFHLLRVLEAKRLSVWAEQNEKASKKK